MAGPETVGIQIIVIVFMVLFGNELRRAPHGHASAVEKAVGRHRTPRLPVHTLRGMPIVVASLLINGGTMFYIDDTHRP